MRKRTIGTLIAGACAMVFMFGGSVLAADGSKDHSRRYQADIKPVNPTEVAPNLSGKVHFDMDDDYLAVRVHVTGSAAGVVHMQQIRGFFPASGAKCPTLANDVNKDGYIDIFELGTTAGAVAIPLNEEPAAMNMKGKGYPKADAEGAYRYSVQIPMRDVAELFDMNNFAQGVICIFGANPDTKLPETVATYEGLPAQAALPVGCGKIFTVD